MSKSFSNICTAHLSVGLDIEMKFQISHFYILCWLLTHYTHIVLVHKNTQLVVMVF